MKRFGFICCLLAVLVLTGAGTGVSFAAAPKTIQIGHVNPSKDDDQYHRTAVLFGKYLEELSKGAITVEILSDSQLGGERDMMEGMQMGTVDGSVMTNLAIGAFVPQFHLYNLPFLFATRDEAYALLDDPEIMDILSRELYDEYQIKFLSWAEGGYRHVIQNVRPINTVADLKGIKIRLPETPIYVNTFRILGSNPTTMATSEMFTAVQQKTVDGLENPIISIRGMGFYEICKYLSLTGHFYSPISLCLSRQVWEKLTPEEQGWVMEAAKKVTPEQRAFVQSIESRFIAEMKKEGLVVNEVKDKAQFRAAVQPVYDEYRKEIGEDLVAKLEQKLEKLRSGK